MTQREAACSSQITAAMERVAAQEQVPASQVLECIVEGTVVIPCNPDHAGLRPCGIGKGLTTKVNANLGTSSDYPALESELAKLQAACDCGSDTVMDLSTAGDLDAIRRALVEASPLPLGTVPVYQAVIETQQAGGNLLEMSADRLFDVIERHAKDGVDFITVHCGVTQASLRRLKEEGRIADIVSRGGCFLAGWILHRGEENPLFEQYDRLLEIARAHDVTLSLGDGLRPGCLADATDRAQVEELLILGELVERAWKAGVQVMVEGPGHVPLHQIQANIQLQKRVCKGAPFYVLGPLVTDVAAGFDHIAGAIGGAFAAWFGADFLCYVTPAEHLGLPDVEDVRQGVMASRVAGHAADIARGLPSAWQRDLEMAKARKGLDWEKQAKLSLYPSRARHVHELRRSRSEACSMCGEYCAMQLATEYLRTAT